MGTCNFANYNSRKIHAVLMNYQQPILDENGDETDEMETISPELWEVNEFKETVMEALDTLKTKYKVFSGDDIPDQNFYG